MASGKKLDANRPKAEIRTSAESRTLRNRLNAQRSTGPRTPEGKAVSRFNSLRHGLRAKTIVLPGEDQQEFDHLLGSLEEDFPPQSSYEDLLIQKVAIAEWRLVRVQNVQNELHAKDSAGLETIAAYDRLLQMEARLERASLRAYKELDRLRTQRLKQAAQEETDEEEEEPEMKPAIKFCPGLMWIQNGEDYEASPPKIKHQDGTWEVLYPGDPRRKEYGWNFEPDREHARDWDPKTDPRRKPDSSPPAPPGG